MTVREGQDRLRNIGQRLKSGEALSTEDRTFLSAALIRIADGGKSDTELGVKAKRGERKGKNDRISKEKRSFALGWIAVAKTPEAEGGLGLSLEAACAKLYEIDGEVFGFTEETLRTYWNMKDADRGLSFQLKK